MGSRDAAQLAVLGGRPAFEQAAPEDEGTSHDALRARIPDASTKSVFDTIHASALTFEKVLGTKFVDAMYQAASFREFLDQHPELPFSFVPTGPNRWSRFFTADLQYMNTAWEDLLPEAVVRVLADELGLDPADVGLDGEDSLWGMHPRHGILRIPAEFFRRPGAFGVFKRALLKLSDAYNAEATHDMLIEWANKPKR